MADKKVELRVVAYENTEGGINFHRHSDRCHYTLESAAAELEEAEAEFLSPWYGGNAEWIIEGVFIRD